MVSQGKGGEIPPQALCLWVTDSKNLGYLTKFQGVVSDWISFFWIYLYHPRTHCRFVFPIHELDESLRLTFHELDWNLCVANHEPGKLEGIVTNC